MQSIIIYILCIIYNLYICKVFHDMFRTRLKALRKRPFLTVLLLSPLSSLLSLKTLLSLKGPSSLPSTTTGTKDCNSTHLLLVAICKFLWGKFRSLITSSREISISLSSRCSLEHLTIFSLMKLRGFTIVWMLANNLK